jgi:hypothetical protein
MQRIEKCKRKKRIGIGLQRDKRIPCRLADVGKSRDDSRAIIHY